MCVCMCMHVRVRMFLLPFLLLFPLAIGYADAIYFLRCPAILFENDPTPSLPLYLITPTHAHAHARQAARIHSSTSITLRTFTCCITG